MRVRGLKLKKKVKTLIIKLVAPHAGAWIETELQSWLDAIDESHPMRVRGLKQMTYHL